MLRNNLKFLFFQICFENQIEAKKYDLFIFWIPLWAYFQAKGAVVIIH